MKRLENKVAIITGAAGGIGAATAERFALEGALGVLWDVKKDGLETVSQKLKADGHQHLVQVVNIADATVVERAVADVLETFGQIDILINNAGITRDARLVKMSYEQRQQVLDVNLNGVFNTTILVRRIM